MTIQHSRTIAGAACAAAVNAGCSNARIDVFGSGRYRCYRNMRLSPFMSQGQDDGLNGGLGYVLMCSALL